MSALVLASGLSRRFGTGDKLLAPLLGRPLAAHIAAKLLRLGCREHIAVCANREVAALFEGFQIALNGQPEAGLGQTLRIGAERATSDWILVCLADMPFVSVAHLARLCRERTGNGIATSGPGYLGPPALLSRAAVLRLNLDGDQGARSLIKTLPTLAAAAGELRDFDTAEDWNF